MWSSCIYEGGVLWKGQEWNYSWEHQLPVDGMSEEDDNPQRVYREKRVEEPRIETWALQC